ncbi:MAG: CheB methylesterase domain-containing protein [Campylobacterota bacterium]|nr:CheB methylesterase domain-containing protein [Campylobacterota bacterium]
MIKRYGSKIIVIGLSTGGLDVLENFIPKLPSNKIPPILIVQHSSRDLSKTFIPKLIEKSNIDIKVAKNNEIIKENTIYFPPFNNHLLIKEVENDSYKIIITSNNLHTFHKPSIDILFSSIAEEVKQNSIAFILTGMGNDGVKGISNIKKNGGKTFAQNELSSKVFGMPKSAIKLGIIDKIIDIDEIVREVISSY